MTLGMLGMSFAAVPLYQIFCQVTGYGGTTQKADDTTGVILNKKITIRFDANISNDLDWHFAPVEREVTLKIGEKGQTSYIAKNTWSLQKVEIFAPFLSCEDSRQSCASLCQEKVLSANQDGETVGQDEKEGKMEISVEDKKESENNGNIGVLNDEV